MAGKSSTGTTKPITDMRNWRKQLQASRVKFDDKLKVKYLEFLLDHGKKTVAARQCDISYTTVQEHRINDPDFEAIENIVIEERGARIVRQLEEEAVDGHEEQVYNKDGNVVGTRTKYETQLRVMILKRYDPEYKDRQDINLSGSVGGVLVAPATLALDDLKAQGQALRDKMLETQKQRKEDDAARKES